MFRTSICLKTLIICLFVGVISFDVNAQEADSEPQLVRIETKDGNTFLGTIVEEGPKEIVLKTKELGQITIRKENISSISNYDAEKSTYRERRYKNPQPTRYFFGTNALPIEKGEGYYQNVYVFFNNANVGLSENFSIGAGFVPVFLLGAGALPIWVLPKFSVPVMSDNIHLAVGGLFGGIVGEVNTSVGLAYSTLTVGNTDHNATMGLGYGYFDGSWADIPIINLSAMTRISDNVYLISENFFVSTGGSLEGLMLFGARVTRFNFAVDFSLIRPTEDVGMIGWPSVGITLPFGK